MTAAIGAVRRGTAAVLALCSLAGSGAAAERPALPGIAGPDRRVVVNALEAPWNAIAKVQTNIGTRCTGVLIAPATVLTAAHCLYNRRTRALLQPLSLHVLLGSQLGDFRWHREVVHYTIGASFDGTLERVQSADWARLDLDGPIPPAVTPLPLARQLPEAGAPAALAGYNLDRALLLMADRGCHVIAVSRPNRNFITHDCDATRGASGAPLLVAQDGGWAVAGINVAAGAAANIAVAAPFGE